MSITIRNITADETEQFRHSLASVFAFEPADDPNGSARFRALIDPGQLWAAFDQDQIVATAGSYNFRVGIPGGVLPMAGLTLVTVKPTHRRRGILRQLMQAHLDDASNRNFAVSGLFASEASIYGRFGFGVAAHCHAITVTNAHALRFAPALALDSVEWLEEPEARKRLPAIYASATAGRPGVLHRTSMWWQERRFLEIAMFRGGATTRRTVVARRNGVDVGYVVYRQRGGWDDGLPSGKVEIVELISVDGQAESTLWQFMLQIDLFPTVSWAMAPVDGVLPLLLQDSRRVRREVQDNLWLRVNDVAAALSARRYQTDEELHLVVDGESFVIASKGGHGSCTAVGTRVAGAVASLPTIVMDRCSLAQLYLGSGSATQLADAGTISGTSEAVFALNRLFAWPVAAWCPEVF
jgi:predicted acetyltransferase